MFLKGPLYLPLLWLVTFLYPISLTKDSYCSAEIILDWLLQISGSGGVPIEHAELVEDVFGGLSTVPVYVQARYVISKEKVLNCVVFFYTS